MLRGYKKIVVHHIFLATTALLMIKQTLIMSGVAIFNPYKYLIVFLSTIIVYQLAASNIRFPFKPSRLHQNTKWIVMMIAMILTLTFLVVKLLSSQEFILLLFILISSFGYFTAIGNWKGLRAIPAVKAILLALAWSVVTVAFPLVMNWNRNTHFILLLQRFLFILPVCIIYNLRDVEIDKRHGVVTIAIIAGEKNTKLIAGFFLLLFVLSVLFYETNVYFKTALLLSALITALAISKAKINGKEFYYKYIIDGCMTLQALMMILFI